MKMLFAVFLGRGILAARQLLLVPVFLQCWGTEYFGEWLVISSIPAFLSMSNLGLGTSASIEINRLVSDEQVRIANELYKSTVIVLAVTFTAVLAIASSVLFLMQFAGVSLALHITSPSLVVTLLICASVVRLISSSNNGWWVASGKASLATHWWNASLAGDAIVTAIALLFGGSALSVSIALVSWSICWLAAFQAFTNFEILKILKVRQKAVFSWGRVRPLLWTGLGHQLRPLWQAVYFQGSIVLVGVMLGANYAAAWGSLRIAVRSGSQIIEIVAESFGPEMQLSYAGKDHIRLKGLYNKGTWISIVFSILFVVLGFFSLQPLFTFWTHGKFAIDAWCFRLLLIGLIPLAMWRVGEELFRSINRPWLTTPWAFLFSIASMLPIVLIVNLGIGAAVLGSLFFDIAMACITWKACKIVFEKTELAPVA